MTEISPAAIAADRAIRPAPVAEGEVAELVAWLRSTRTARLTRAAELLEQRHPEPVRLQQLETLAADAVSALRYIEQHHGRLYGVGWDRVFSEAAKLQPAPIPALPEDATVIEPSERTILVPHQAPVPVSERPWEREGWCDGQGWCWCFFLITPLSVVGSIAVHSRASMTPIACRTMPCRCRRGRWSSDHNYSLLDCCLI